MEQQVKHYEFVNSQTGNVIAYVSVPAHTEHHELHEKLEKKRAELAVKHQIYLELIYWQDPDHAIK